MNLNVGQFRWRYYRHEMTRLGKMIPVANLSEEWKLERRKSVLTMSTAGPALFNVGYKTKLGLLSEKCTGKEIPPDNFTQKLMDQGTIEEPVIKQTLKDDLKAIAKGDVNFGVVVCDDPGIYARAFGPLACSSPELEYYDKTNLRSSASPDMLIYCFYYDRPRATITEKLFTVELKFRASGNMFETPMNLAHFAQLYSTCMHTETAYGVYIQKKYSESEEGRKASYLYRIFKRDVEIDKLFDERIQRFHLQLKKHARGKLQESKFPRESRILQECYEKSVVFRGISDDTLQPLYEEMIRITAAGESVFRANQVLEDALEEEHVEIEESSEQKEDSEGWTHEDGEDSDTGLTDGKRLRRYEVMNTKKQKK